MSHLDELVDLSAALENRHLVPHAPEDFLYLSLAFMWANPERSLGYLKSATGVSGDVVNIIRSAASGHLALDQIDPEEGLKLARTAVTAAAAVQADDNAFTLGRLIQARTIAAIYLRILGRENEASYRQMVQDADNAVPPIGESGNADVNHSIYCLYLQTGREDKALKFLMDLDDGSMDDYSRAYRIIAQIELGNMDQAQRDYRSFQTDRENRQPLLTLVELANLESERELQTLASTFDDFIEDRWKQSDVLHLALCWATSRLLKMKQHENACLRTMEGVLIKYESTYMEKLYAPILQVARGVDRQLVEQEARQTSRKQLTMALFSLGIDALSRGDSESARLYFEKCVAEGWYRFYVCHTARAFLAKMEDPNWVDRIASIPTWVDPDTKAKAEP